MLKRIGKMNLKKDSSSRFDPSRRRIHLKLIYADKIDLAQKGFHVHGTTSMKR